MVLVSMAYWSSIELSVSGAMHEHRVICVESRIQASSHFLGKQVLIITYNTFAYSF